jgi:hypothetical protein
MSEAERDHMAHVLGPRHGDAVEVMQRLKAAPDPLGLINPGRLGAGGVRTGLSSLHVTRIQLTAGSGASRWLDPGHKARDDISRTSADDTERNSAMLYPYGNAYS